MACTPKKVSILNELEVEELYIYRHSEHAGRVEEMEPMHSVWFTECMYVIEFVRIRMFFVYIYIYIAAGPQSRMHGPCICPTPSFWMGCAHPFCMTGYKHVIQ